jgi:TRAP transporter TAXI family solute receptor
MATLIEKYSKDISCSVQAGTTATENFKLVGRKDADIGIGGTDSAYYAYRGLREFDKKYDKLRWLIKGYISLNHTIVLKDSPYMRIEDLKGKRIASYPGSTAEFQTPAILEAFNMVPGKDYVKIPLKIGEAVAALKDGHVDAIVQVGGIPMSAVTDIAATKGIRLLEIPEDKQTEITKKYPWFVKGIIPAGSYPGINKDIRTVGHDVIIFSHADLPLEVIYLIMSSVFDHGEELAQVHPLGGTFKKETGFIGSERIIPLHPGAEKYYKDRGLLK